MFTAWLSKSIFYEIRNIARQPEYFLFSIAARVRDTITPFSVALCKVARIWRFAIGAPAKWSILGVSFPLALAKVVPTRGSKFRSAWETRQKRARSGNEHRIPGSNYCRGSETEGTQLRTLVRNSLFRAARQESGAGCERTNVWMQARLRNSWLRRGASYNYCSSAERKAIVYVCVCRVRDVNFSGPFLFRTFSYFAMRRDSRDGPVKQL